MKLEESRKVNIKDIRFFGEKDGGRDERKKKVNEHQTYQKWKNSQE